MKCELCHVREAGCVLHREKDGGMEELYVCEVCREKGAGVATEHDLYDDMGLDELFGLEEREHGEGEPFLGEELEFVEGEPNEPACRVCRMPRSELRRGQRLGCPACYKAFAHEVALMIRDMHKGKQHVEEK